MHVTRAVRCLYRGLKTQSYPYSSYPLTIYAKFINYKILRIELDKKFYKRTIFQFNDFSDFVLFFIFYLYFFILFYINLISREVERCLTITLF